MTSLEYPLSEAVISAVAKAEGVDKTELDPRLYDAINPDSLDTLFRGNAGKVEFQYIGYTVIVDHEGEVSLAGRDS